MINLADSVLAAICWNPKDETVQPDIVSESLAARIGAISGLKTFPVVAQKVLSMLDKPDFTVDTVSDTIREDPSLAAGVLRLANSPFYASTHPVNTLDYAFIRLGKNTVKEAVFAVATMRLFPQTTGLGKMIRDHCAATAAIGHCLSKIFKIGEPEIVFLCGLMHDVGKMLLIDSREIEYPASIEQAMTFDQIHLYEKEKLGFDHAILAGQVLTRWNLGEPIAKIVAWHHCPELALKDKKTGLMVSLLRLADNIENQLRFQLVDDKEFLEDIKNSQDAKLAGIEKTRPEQVESCWELIKEAREKSLEIFGG